MKEGKGRHPTTPRTLHAEFTELQMEDGKAVSSGLDLLTHRDLVTKLIKHCFIGNTAPRYKNKKVHYQIISEYTAIISTASVASFII